MASSTLTQTQAQQIVSLFNGASTQQKYSITIRGSAGNQSTSSFTFSLQKPSIISETLSSVLQPWNWISTAGQVWTGVTTGNADVVLNTYSEVDVNSGVNNFVLDNANPIGTENLSIVTPANMFNFLYHQIDNAVTVVAQIFYCSSTGALVGLTVTPNSGVITSAGYSIVSQSSPMMTNIGLMTGGSALGQGSYALLQVGTLDTNILSIANTTSVTANSSSGQLTQTQESSGNSSTPTVTVTPTNNSTGSSGSSSGSSGSATTTTSQPASASTSTGSSSQYSTTTTPTSSGGSNPSSGSSNLTTYLIIGGVVAAGIVALMFFMRKKK